VLAAEHLLDFAAIDQRGKAVDAGRQLIADVLSLRGPVDEHAKVVRRRLQRRNQLDLLFDAPAPLEDLLGLDLVVPEIRLGCAGFYLCELVCGACGFKDNSGGRRRV
jgi:hypothetical protein